MMKKILIALSIILLIATPYFNHLVELERGYTAIGGECFVWLFPLIAIGFIDGIDLESSDESDVEIV